MKIKQLTIALMALGLSGVAVAGSFTPPAAEPAPQPKWFIGGDAIYGETGHDNSVYATGPGTTAVTQFVADRDDEFGFKLWAGYDAGDGTSYTADWFRFHNDGKTSTAAGLGATLTPNPINGPGVIFTTLTGQQESDMDQATAQIGHTFKNNNGINVKVHAGVQALFLDATNTYTGDAAAAASDFIAGENSSFDGGGIVAGVDLEHMCGNAFSIFSHNQVGLVYGKQDSDYARVGNTSTTISTENQYTLLPTFNAELGAAYTMQLASMDFRIQGGVRGTVVVDGIQNYTTLATGAAATTNDRVNWTEASVFLGAQVAFSNLGGLFS